MVFTSVPPGTGFMTKWHLQSFKKKNSIKLLFGSYDAEKGKERMIDDGSVDNVTFVDGFVKSKGQTTSKKRQ